MRRLFTLILPFLFGACTLVSPYTITFATPDGKVVNPQTDTLDLVISASALAYISEVECDGAEDVELLPVVDESMQAKTAHNLSLTVLNGAPGSECDVTVTAFDRTTSESAQNSIALVIEGGEEEVTEAAGEEAEDETSIQEGEEINDDEEGADESDVQEQADDEQESTDGNADQQEVPSTEETGETSLDIQ